MHLSERIIIIISRDQRSAKAVMRPLPDREVAGSPTINQYAPSEQAREEEKRFHLALQTICESRLHANRPALS